MGATPQPVKSSQGPPNSNLFIYHIPVNWTENEMMQCFSPFGTVVSATIFKDKVTQQSKVCGIFSVSCNIASAHSERLSVQRSSRTQGHTEEQGVWCFFAVQS